MQKILIIFFLIAITTFCHGQETSIDSTNNPQIISPFDHLGSKGEAHWFSDAVAGVLMGASIGWYIGNTFYQEKNRLAGIQDSLNSYKFTIWPLIDDKTKGVVASLNF